MGGGRHSLRVLPLSSKALESQSKASFRIQLPHAHNLSKLGVRGRGAGKGAGAGGGFGGGEDKEDEETDNSSYDMCHTLSSPAAAALLLLLCAELTL